MKLTMIVIAILTISGCGSLSNTRPANAYYVCGTFDSTRSGIVQINGVWRSCRYENGVPVLTEPEVEAL